MSQTNGLKRNSNASFVQQPDSDLITVAHTTKHSLGIDDAVCERNLTSAAGTYAELVLIAANVQARVSSLNDEGCDSFVSDRSASEKVRATI